MYKAFLYFLAQSKNYDAPKTQLVARNSQLDDNLKKIVNFRRNITSK